MNNDDRNEMIRHICERFTSWASFHSRVVGDRSVNVSRKVDGWFICFDGPEINDMYLQSEDPRGDLQGQVITCSDCFDCFEVRDGYL